MLRDCEPPERLCLVADRAEIRECIPLRNPEPLTPYPVPNHDLDLGKGPNIRVSQARDPQREDRYAVERGRDNDQGYLL